MDLILALPALAEPGGPQTYTVTVAEHLARLGHAVTISTQRTGAVAAQARERGLRVVRDPEELPARADAVLGGVDRALAFDLAARYPDAVRIWIAHGLDEIHGPPPADGVVHATVALNDHFAALSRAAVGSGEVVRMTQPVDLRHFSPAAWPRERPRTVLLLGNYLEPGGERHRMLTEAWRDAELEWQRLGHPDPSLAVPEALAQADIVVGYGRSILEAMCAGRAAFVFDHAGYDGWVTPDSYARIESAGFAGTTGTTVDADALRADLAAYDAGLGRQVHDLARAHHDARRHAADLVALVERLAPAPPPQAPDALRALTQLAAAQLRAEVASDQHRMEAAQWFRRTGELHERLAEVDAERARAEAELAAVRAGRAYRLSLRLARVARRIRRLASAR